MKHKPNRSKHQKGKRDIQRLSRLCATSFWEWCDPSMSHQAITVSGEIDDALPFDWLCILSGCKLQKPAIYLFGEARSI